MENSKLLYLLMFLIFTFSNGCEKEDNGLIDEEVDQKIDEEIYSMDTLDMLSPAYYLSSTEASFIESISQFVSFAQEDDFHHPLENEMGEIPDFNIPSNGEFGAGKGPTFTEQHHPAADLHVGNRATDVNLYAAYDGYLTTVKDSDKYRHYISLATDIFDDQGQSIGKMVSLYAHVDLDLDEAESMNMNGQLVEKGDLISRNLYSGTVGGPHLHFEIRYYRSGEAGDEVFYGYKNPERPNLTEPSAGSWMYGVWDPNVGYGFGDPVSHGLEL